EHFQVHDDQGGAVIVEGHGAELRHLIDPERVDVYDRQIPAVDHALLGRRDDLAPGHRHRIAAKAGNRVGKYLGKLYANLAPAEILGLDDRTLVGPEVTIAVVVEEQRLDLVFFLEFLAEPLTDLAIEHGVGRIVVLHEIRDEERAHLRKDGRRGAGRAADCDIAGLDGIHDLQFLRDQRTAVEFHGESAFGPLVELLGHPFERDGGRFRRRDDVSPQELPGRGLREDRSAAGGEDAGKTGTGLQHAAAGQWSGGSADRHALPSSLHFLFFRLPPAHRGRAAPATGGTPR